AVTTERIERDLRAALVDVLGRRPRGLFSLLDVDDLLATHRAGVAGTHLHPHLIAYRNRVYLRDGVGGAQAIVEHGHTALEALALHGRAGPELVERPVLLVHGAGDPFGDGQEPALIGDLHRCLAAHGDGLEPLRAHDRAHAGASRHLVQLVGDAGVT